jgi:chorismate synthase
MPKPCIRSRRRKEQRRQGFDQRGYADRLISQKAIYTDQDPVGYDSYRETVNSLTPGQVAVELQKEYNTFDLGVINRVRQGEVLSNTFCEGINDPKILKPEELVIIGWEP